ncbi:photosynthetic NDH subunit of subcomplex B 3 protein [Thalictrum thalictroides]|uniref:Photosynthetic NDH subunit of subcomplex B 3 protein n=1 Tax=Thalictrum thalictroides TaxID=46969 RepID=A0A7J6VN70_THATH|nr:photosynthetic NDH subunit of subcomplex B 3 protein [Thalictrum thalictroides]
MATKFSVLIGMQSLSSRNENNSLIYRRPKTNYSILSSKNKPIYKLASSTITESTTSSNPEKNPKIELEFIGPKVGGDGNYPVEKASAISGDKLLRNIMSDNNIELYATYGKVMNCGGGGSCGTCIVEIIDGKDLLNERTNTELRYLKKKPESWRLACQTIVGNKENSGKVVVQRLPQWKK